MYGQLGSIVFEGLIGFDSFEREGSVTLVQQPLINNIPRVDFTGIELQEINATIRLHASFCDVETELDNMWAAMESGTIMPLLYGNGRIVGDFAIEKLRESIKQTDGEGNFIEVQLSISLLQYVIVDKDSLKKQQARANARSVESNNPKVVRGQLRVYQTPGGSLTTSVSSAGAEANKVNGLIDEANKFPDLNDFNSKNIIKSLDNINNYMGIMQGILDGNIDVLNRIPGMPANIIDVINASDNLRSVMPISNITDVMNLNSILQIAIGKMKVTNAISTGASITKKI